MPSRPNRRRHPPAGTLVVGVVDGGGSLGGLRLELGRNVDSVASRVALVELVVVKLVIHHLVDHLIILIHVSTLHVILDGVAVVVVSSLVVLVVVAADGVPLSRQSLLRVFNRTRHLVLVRKGSRVGMHVPPRPPGGAD